MKHVSLFILVAIAMVFAACDGRDRLHKTPQEILHESELLDSFSETITYVPETYAEVKTDTLLANGFHIKIRTYTDMERSVLDTTKTDSIISKTYYRDIKSQVIVFKEDQEIFNKTIDKSFFTDTFAHHEADLKRMTLQSAHVNQLPNVPSTETDAVQIAFYYVHISRDLKKQYQLQIQPNGEFDITNFEN
ncbi:hypothetical protein [Bizionia sp.]|uniref:hypothetical protein n=1 Tax=Bizionia sp. TaxID=1954480 RepID=UPI003A91B79B